MKQYVLPALLLAVAGALSAAEPKEEVKAAAKKLADQPNYAWTTTREIEGGQFTPRPIQGKTEKGGFTCLKQETDNATMEAFRKGEKAVVKTDDGWKTSEELDQAASGGGGQGGGRFMGRMLLRSKPVAEEVLAFVEKLKELKAGEAGVLQGALTEEGAKELLSFRRRPGGQAPEVKEPKGAVKIWLKEGALVKYELKLSGTFAGRDGQERSMSSTTTVEIKEVGKTKVEVPDEVKKKLAS